MSLKHLVPGSEEAVKDSSDHIKWHSSRAGPAYVGQHVVVDV